MSASSSSTSHHQTARRRSSSRGHISVEKLDQTQYERWSRLVRESPSGSAYSLPAYLDALSSAGGGRYVVLGAVRGDEIVGGIAVYERSTPLGSIVAPRLLLYYNGFVLRDYDTRYPSERTNRQVEAVGALAAALEARGYGRLEVHSRGAFTDMRPLLHRGWRVKPSYSYVVPLTDLEEQWGRTEQNLRRLVERGRAEGLELVVDEDFESYYRLHSATASRKGAPLYLPAAEFGRYYEALRDQGLCRLYHARLPDGRVAASQLVLTGHPVTHTVSAAADSDLQSTGANAFLRWSAFEDLASLGHTANDLTDATLGSVTRFKSQLGGTLETSFVAGPPMTAPFGTVYRLYGWARRLRRARRG